MLFIINENLLHRVIITRLQAAAAVLQTYFKTRNNFLHQHLCALAPTLYLPALQNAHCRFYGVQEVVRTGYFSSADTDDTMAENKFSVDYAKRIAGCKKCKSKIDKGELRLAKVVPNFFRDGDGEMKQYHHPKCMFETFIRARAGTKIIEEPDDLQGFTDLQQDDKNFLNNLIKGKQNH